MNQEEKIDWNKFEDRYVKLVTDVEKKLKLTQWRDGIYFGKPGLSFTVIEEDTLPVSKLFSASSRKLIETLKPLILEAGLRGDDVIVVSILRLGEGFETRYSVKEHTTPLKEMLE